MINVKIPYVVYPLILGLMCGWLLSAVIAGKSLAPKPLPSTKTVTENRRLAPSVLAGEVVSKNAFGLSLAPVSAANSETGGTGPASAVPFSGKLIGIIQNAKNKAGIAIINMDGQTISIKTGGEKEGLKLVSIDNITAVIEKSGRTYNVVLEGGDTQSIMPKNNAGDKAPAPAGSNLNVSIKKDEVRSELKDLNKVLQSALVSPLYNNGDFQGYRVTRMKDDSPLKKLGLNQGDIITRVNGSDLKSPEILFSMLSQIDDISAISIDMIRDNDKKTLFVELQ